MSTGDVKRSSSFWMWFVPIVSFALVYLRIVHLGPPGVFADEYSYAIWAKHFFDGSVGPPIVPDINNWLYLRVMSLAFLFDGDVTFHARLINSVLAASSAVPVFLIVARRGPVLLAALSGLLYAVCCAGNFAAYFMPEAMSFAAFAFTCLLLFRFIEKPSTARLCVLAAFFATTLLIKVHAIFLLPPLLLAIFATMGLKRHAWLCGVTYCLAFLVVALITNLAVSFALSFKFSFNILGGFYGGLASNSTHGATWHVLGNAAHILGNHLLIILPLALAPLLFIGLAAGRAWKARFSASNDDVDWAAFSVFMVISLATLICVTALFTAVIATDNALHLLYGRYYENATVMVIVIGWASAVPLRLGLALPVAVASSALTAAGVWFITAHGWNSPNDYSIVYMPFTGGKGLNYFIAFALCSLIAIIPRWPSTRYLMVFAGTLYFFMNAHAIDHLRHWIRATDEDSIPVPGGAQSKVVVLADSFDASLYRAAYTLMDRKVTVFLAPRPKCASLPSETAAIVSLQNIGPVCGFIPHYSSGRVWVGLRPASSP
jgi:Dolichyl-phosphate-mannose-protein mannosyltransferase